MTSIIAVAALGVISGMLAILVVGIHRDDRAKNLTHPAKSPVEAATRRILGVGVRTGQRGGDEDA